MAIPQKYTVFWWFQGQISTDWVRDWQGPVLMPTANLPSAIGTMERWKQTASGPFYDPFFLFHFCHFLSFFFLRIFFERRADRLRYCFINPFSSSQPSSSPLPPLPALCNHQGKKPKGAPKEPKAAIEKETRPFTVS